MEPGIFGRSCKRGAPTPLLFRCNEDGYQTRVDRAVDPVLVVDWTHASRAREFILPDFSSRFMETLHARAALHRSNRDVMTPVPIAFS